MFLAYNVTAYFSSHFSSENVLNLFCCRLTKKIVHILRRALERVAGHGEAGSGRIREVGAPDKARTHSRRQPGDYLRQIIGRHGGFPGAQARQDATHAVRGRTPRQEEALQLFYVLNEHAVLLGERGDQL